MSIAFTMSIKSKRLLAFLILAATCCASESLGWRGDGTGKFPDTNPPLTWERVSPAMKGLRFQAKKPEGEQASGKPMLDGVIREWLLLGPVPETEKERAIGQDTIPNELEISPAEGDKVDALSWKRIDAESSTIDLLTMLGENAKPFAYFHAYVFSENAGEFLLQITYRKGARVALNGKQLFTGTAADGRRTVLKLNKGWNRLLLKIGADEKNWFESAVILSKSAKTYEEKNIAWRVPLPGIKTYFGTPAATGGPIVVGEKIFVCCEPHDLFCLNKSDGKILWARSNGYFDALTDAEKAADPAFKEIEPLAAKLNAISEAWVSGGEKAKEEERDKAEKAYYGALAKIDKVRFKRPEGQDIGYAGLTPTSDGKLVWVWFASGVAACYDLDGNRKWIRLDNHAQVEHGYSSSPVLVGGKLVVFMRDLMAFDALTGKEAWRNPIVTQAGLNPAGWFHGSLGHATINGVETVLPASGTVINAADGSVIFADKRNLFRQAVASPVVEDSRVYFLSTWSETLYSLPFPQPGQPFAIDKELKIPTTQLPHFYLGWHIASPLVYDGLIYLLNNAGVLTVVDEKSFTIVYQRILDIDAFQNSNEGAARGVGVSPVMGGKRIYLFGNSGACVVLEPGREFKQLAKNKIEGVAMQGTWGERQERVVANPFIDGKRIYYRSEGGLYALGD